MAVKDKDGNILQYIEFDSFNPANIKMAIKNKNKNLLQTIEINSQTQQTVVKDETGNVQFTSQIEGDKVIVRDAQGRVLKETPKSEIQSQMPDMSLSQLPATSTLPLTLTPYPTQPPAMELPPYLQQQTRRPRTSVMPSDTIPEWNPDFILNSTFTSCCGCNWCGCGGTGGSCVDPNIKCGGPPPPPTDPCNDPCAPPPTNTSGMLWAEEKCCVITPTKTQMCDDQTKSCRFGCSLFEDTCTVVGAIMCFGLGGPTIAGAVVCSYILYKVCSVPTKICEDACNMDKQMCLCP